MSICRSPPLKLPEGEQIRPLAWLVPPRLAVHASETLLQFLPLANLGSRTESVPLALPPVSEPLTVAVPDVAPKRPLRIAIWPIEVVLLAVAPLLQRSSTAK